MRVPVLMGLFLCLTATAWPQIPLPVGDANYDASNKYVFRDDALTTIDVTMAPADLSDMMANPWNDVEYPCSMRFRNAIIDETVNDIRIKIRGATSRKALKKSFRLSYNSVVKGTRFHGLKKLNLIGDQNDVSIVRAKLALDTLRRMGMAAQRAVIVHFRINDGARIDDIYVGEEQVNDDFIGAWFGTTAGHLYKCGYQGERADLRYVAPGDAATYQNLGGGETYSEELSKSPDYTDLADFIRFINASSAAEFERDLPQWLNVESFLRNMAADIVIGQWDGYWFGANNYFLYHNPATNLFEYLPYDYDNTFGIDFFGTDWARKPVENWGSGGFGSNPDLPPLIRRVLAVPAWERQLRRYVRDMVGAPSHLASTAFADTEGDTFLSPAEPHFDILRADVSNNDASLVISVKVGGPVGTGGTTDDARFMFYFDTKPGGSTANPWRRSVNSTAASDYFIGAWVNNGSGFTAYRATSAGGWSWARSSTSGNTGGIDWDLSGKQSGIVRISIPLAELGLSPGASFTFDVATGNIRSTTVEPGIDHLSNAAPATPDYDTPSTPGPFRSYTLQAGPSTSANALFSPGVLFPLVDQAKALALPFAYRGPTSGSGMDWGWTADEFSASFDGPTNYSNPGRPWNWGVKPYIATRTAWVAANVPMPAPLPAVSINEVIPLNASINRDEAGDYDGWIELYNADPTAVDLGGMYLTNSALSPRKWRIPDGTVVPSHGFLLVWADNEPAEGPLHAPFRLSADGGTVALYDTDANHNLQIAALVCPAASTNVSFGRFPDGADTHMAFTTVTPGAPNSDAPGTIVHKALPPVRINEFMASNSATVADEYGEHDDWIELYNASVLPVDMGGRYLSDSLTNRTKFRFPAGTVIPSGGYLVVWADGQPEQGPLHTSYKLSADGEEIALYDGDDNSLEVIDSLTFGPQTTDVSVGRPCDGAPGMVMQPSATPGAANAGACTPVGPTILAHPGSRTLMVGQTISLSVSVSGSVPMTFVWRKGGLEMADGDRVYGSRTPTLLLGPGLLGDAGKYDVVVTNGGGTATSRAAEITIGRYTLTDVAAALHVAAGLPAGAASASALDADGNGVVDAADATAILRAVAGV